MKDTGTATGAIIRPLLFALLIPAGTPVQALAQDWLVGGSIGVARQDDYSVTGGFTRNDDSDTAFRLSGGYQISPTQAVVASWIDLGEPTYAGPAFGGFMDYISAEGIDISYVAGLKPGDQSRTLVYGKVGVMSWDQDVRLTDASGSFIANEDGTSFSVGFGAEINLSADGSNAWSILADYQLFKDIGDEDNSGVQSDRQMISVGVAYRFGN